MLDCKANSERPCPHALNSSTQKKRTTCPSVPVAYRIPRPATVHAHISESRSRMTSPEICAPALHKKRTQAQKREEAAASPKKKQKKKKKGMAAKGGISVVSTISNRVISSAYSFINEACERRPIGQFCQNSKSCLHVDIHDIV
ncbi:hypothetical protein EYR41_007658 [Orbilia oligospora]|uniref:Uncharacterized protein n=1 Tax=Orbilia oligospora TaxID=2813651 RepID=A0A8H2DXN7_ORBOL|nr:hypothetical protein EYR41_007658 [Orbilia oligospora]